MICSLTFLYMLLLIKNVMFLKLYRNRIKNYPILDIFLSYCEHSVQLLYIYIYIFFFPPFINMLLACEPWHGGRDPALGL